jgi:hypothetical protein
MSGANALQIPGSLGEDYNPLNMTAGGSGFATRSYDPVWSLRNPVGTESLPRYADPTAREIAPSPNMEYGSVLPYAMNPATGELHWAMPSSAREFTQGLYDLTQGMKTGQMTPEASAALFALMVPNPLARPEAGVLTAGGRRVGPRNALEGAAAEPEFTPTPGLAGRAEAPPLAPGEIDRVSTRIPTAVGKRGQEAPIDPHSTADLKIGIDAARDSAEAYPNNAMTLRDGDFPDLPVKGLRNPESIAGRAVSHMADNLVWLHNQMVERFGQPVVDRASNWYDGANKIAADMADKFGYSVRQMAGVLANLSPQKDWYQNADLGRRLVDIVTNKADQTMTPEMNKWATDYLAAQAEKADTPSKQAALADAQMSLNSMRRGTRLGDINDPDTRAFFVRAYDEAHNARDYPIVTPEGGFGDLATNTDGSNSKVGWGSFGEIKKALAALNSDDLASISRGLGGNHKVRSFYNNIISPNAQHGDTTIDTHAIAAAHLRPLAGSDFPVEMGLGLAGSSDSATGSKGAYGLYHEAYQQAAKRLGLLPRQLQSITWEGVRGMFSPEQKRDTGFFNHNFDIWQGFRDGLYSADEARRMALEHAGGINAPTWHLPPKAETR